MTRFFGKQNPSTPFDWTTGTVIYTHRNAISDVDSELGVPFHSGVNVSNSKEALIAVKSTGDWIITVYGGVRSYPASSRAWDVISQIESSESRVYKIDCTGIEYLYVSVDELANPITVKVGVI